MTITWEWIMGVGGAIVLIGNVGAVIHRWIKPALDTKKKIETLEDEVVSLKKYAKNDSEAIGHMQEMNKLQCKAMLGMINHMIDGNGVDRMRETRDEIQELLTKY